MKKYSQKNLKRKLIYPKVAFISITATQYIIKHIKFKTKNKKKKKLMRAEFLNAPHFFF